MQTNSFFLKQDLGYDEFLKGNSEIASLYPDYSEIEQLGADKIYFSGSSPAVLFVEVSAFDDDALRRIAGIQHKAWNYRKILLLFALSDTEIRIYNCQEKPSYISKEENPEKKLNGIQISGYNEQSDEKALHELSDVFSRIGVDCGLLWTTDHDARKKVSIQRRLDNFLVQSLIDTASALENDGISDKNVIHGLLMRSLFILFLEDKGAAREAGLYQKIKPEANSYFDILDDIDATYQLFNEVQVHFNGNVFPVLLNERDFVKQAHLELIKKCFIDGNLLVDPTMFQNWRLFNFKIIQIELLSEIYENFLGEFKHEQGQFYTPYSLVELILKDKLPTKDQNYNVKVLDPACGSGIFLVESYSRLIKRWENANPNQKLSFDELKTLLLENIFGIEIDPTAIKVAAFSLYLALVDKLDPKTLWIDNNYQLPYLIFDPEDQNINTQGKNLWRRDTIGEVNPEDFAKIDLVVGNPPFGTKKLAEKSKSIYNYCKDHDFGKEMVLPFMHKAVSFCPNGQIALLFNTKVLTNTEVPFQNFRKWLLQENYVEKVYNLSIFRKAPKNFGGQLFSSAVGPISIVYYQKEQPADYLDTIEYWAPKTYIKSNLIEGVIVDSSDIKHLPRVECLKKNSKIWKIAMWGGILDMKLIERLKSNSISVKDFLSKNDFKSGLGLQFLDNSTKKTDSCNDIPNNYMIPENIERFISKTYSTINDGLSDKSKILYADFYNTHVNNLPLVKDFRRLGACETFISPHFVIKEGLKDWRVCASYIDEDCSFNSKVLGISHTNKSYLKGLTCFFNSSLVEYLLYMLSASIGVEREEIKPNEVKSLPIKLDIDDLILLSKFFEEYESLDFLTQESTTSIFEDNINEIVCNRFNLSIKDKIIINDRMSIGFSQLRYGHKSIAFHRTLESENQAYAEILCNELNAFLSHSKIKVNASICDVGRHDPLNLIVLHFGEVEKPVETKNLANLRENLQNIDRYMLQQKSDSIYVQKQVRYFDNDTVYLIKPNQKRFWTRSQAIDDATSLISEIINMESK
jgi:hypothetical protein